MRTGTSTNIGPMGISRHSTAQQLADAKEENPQQFKQRAARGVLKLLLCVRLLLCDNLLIFFPQSPRCHRAPTRRCCWAYIATTFTENNHLASQIGLNSLGSTSSRIIGHR